ncbi:DOPA-like domain-containing protein [Acrodontium crateriforme]|uniref:DOPA-like domain-containing protein n=1 Tax=Acrodontium crateriforme TaxID=150365 RepID=A0AAQ3R740_9PEZI|nr:DOPA-like domain-containing protein [Acrodontium crateriforme]
MSDPYAYTYPSPLEGYEGLEPLSNEKITEGDHIKGLVNPTPKERSKAYDAFVAPLANDKRGGFDIHIYYLQTNEFETKFAKELHERIRREFPELRTYQIWDRPIGPHPVAMFEVNVFTPEQFGAFVSWLTINRGPLTALVHPNTDDEYRDHTQRAMWMGTPYPLQTGILKN